MTTLTVYADASDNFLESLSDVSYAAARSGSGLLTPGTASGASVTIGQTYSATKGWYCYQGFESFDTSAIPDTATLSNATLDIYGASDFDANSQSYYLTGAKNWGTTVDTGDWVTVANFTQHGWIINAGSSWTTSGYNTFSAFAGWYETAGVISKTGTSYVVVASQRWYDGNAPVGDEYLDYWSADQTGTTQDPKLTVTYTDDQTLNLTGVPSPRAVGTAALGYELPLTGVASPAGVGTATFDPMQDLALTGVPSGEAVGTALVEPGEVELVLTGVPPIAAVGTATVDVLQDLALTGIAATAAVGTALVEHYTELALTGVPSPAAVGTAVVTGDPPAAIIVLVHPLGVLVTDTGERGVRAEDPGLRLLRADDDREQGLQSAG